MFERFTTNARETVHGAVAAAKDLKQGYVGTEHILLALLQRENTKAYQVLAAESLTAQQVREAIERYSGWDAEALDSIGIDLQAIRSKVEESFGPGALDEAPPPKRSWFGKPRQPFTARSRKVLELSLREALALKQNYIGTEHILLGLLREGQGLAARILSDQGVDLKLLRDRTMAAARAA